VTSTEQTTTAVAPVPLPDGKRAAPRPPAERRAKALVNVVLVIILLSFLVPLVWLVLASVDPTASNRTKLPSGITFDNFAAVLNYETLFLPALNSLMLSFGVAILALVASVLAAYPLSRYKLRFGRSFMLGILFATCLPITAIMVPVYSLFVSLRLLDSIPATTLFLAATVLPTAIWMTKNFMDSVPVELEEAAWMDGASRLRALWHVVVPLMRPGLGVVFIFTFIDAWANFFAPFILLLSPTKQPLSVSIYSFFGLNSMIEYGQLAAFSILYAAPVLGLYLIVSKGLGGSFALSGAVKG
jgi:multiple sugar transport system permease protein